MFELMNLLTPAMSAPPADGQGGGSPLGMFVPIILMIVIFYMLIWRPQAQRQKKHKSMIEAIKRGDTIVTNGGLILKVKDVKEDRLVCTTSENVKIEVARSAVSTMIETGHED